jgi:precorrin-2 dehydrogenase / sirohydrochlorin ferrochelatase
MIPIYLDPRTVRVGLVGNGVLCVRRLRWLHNLDAAPRVFSVDPSTDLVLEAGDALERHVPDDSALESLDVLWIADLGKSDAEALAARARAWGVLVNVEDVKPLCDFHTPAIVRRGRLVLAAGTGGASPAAAAAVRERLQDSFSDEWCDALEELAQARESLRAQGVSLEAITQDARDRLRRRALIQ